LGAELLKIRFGIGLPTRTPTFTIAKVAQIAEQLGFDSVWLSDNYATRNAFVGLTHMALTTRSIGLGLGATNPYLVNPAVLASFFGTLNEISGGRSILGIGAGDVNMLQDLGIKQERPISTVREYVQILNELWAGNILHYTGHVFNMARARLQFEIEKPPPIYVAAQGPMMIQLAAEIANGVLINAAHPTDYTFVKTQLDKGFTRLGRKKDTFDVTAYVILSMAQSSTETHEARKIVVAHIIAGAPETVLARHEISQAQVEKLKSLLWQDKLLEAAKMVTPEMLDAFAIVGTPKECLRRIEQLIRTGVTHVVLAPPLAPSPREVLEQLRKKIIFAFLDPN